MFAQGFDSLCASRRIVVLSLATLLATACGGLGCPESFSEVDGVCFRVGEQRETEPEPESSPQPVPNQPRAERCDGIDNDFDDQVDEPWPELGQPCGSSEGECTAGIYVCAADGTSIECRGAVGPSVEICDGLDNDCDGVKDDGSPEVCNGQDDDCDGLIDDGVLSIKSETFDEPATLSSINSGFVLTRSLPNDLRVETYDVGGNRTGHFDDIEKPYAPTEFIESSAAGGRLLVGYGKHRFYVLEALVDDEGVPVIRDLVRLHRDWDQGIDFHVFSPPLSPRLSAAPARFVGFTDVVTFALTPIGSAPVAELSGPPVRAASIPIDAAFDVAGAHVVWEEGSNVRVGWLLDDGTFADALDVGRGTHPAIASREGGPAVAFLQDGYVRLSELNGFSLQCAAGRFCNAPLDVETIEEAWATPVGLAYVDATDTWLVAADDQLLAVGRVGDRAVVQQSWRSDVSGESPTRVDVEASGSTAAVVQSSAGGKSVLTFMGCF